LEYQLNPNANNENTYDLVKCFPKKVEINLFEFLCIFEHQKNKSCNKFQTDGFISLCGNESNPLFINTGFPSNVRVTRTKDKKYLIIIDQVETSLEVYVIRQKRKNYRLYLNDYRLGKYDDEINKFRNAAIPYIKKKN